MFHYFKIPYFTCKFFTKFTYNEYITPYFLSHVVLRFSPSDLPEVYSFSRFMQELVKELVIRVVVEGLCLIDLVH
jgi:hypothetical protein